MASNRLFVLICLSFMFIVVSTLAVGLVRDVRRGQTYWRGAGTVFLGERPGAFWFFIALQSILVLAAGPMLLYGIFRIVTE